MATEYLANSAQTTLTSAINSSIQTMGVASTASFPGSGNFRIRVDNELMLVTGVSGTTWTVNRGVESTTAAAHSSGVSVVQVLTAAVMNTLTAISADQSANTVLASATSGGASTPTFRALVEADLPVAVTGAVVPSGAILAFARTSAPSGWLVCDGSAISRTTYSDLFSAIGTTWGSGDGTTTFNLPDFRRRVAVGSGGTGTIALGNAVGNTGGEETHKLITAEMPSHSHPPQTGNFVSNEANTGVYGVGSFGTLQNSTGLIGSDQAHNNIQPSGVVLMCIKT